MQAAAGEPVELRDAALRRLGVERPVVLGGHQARENLEPAGADHEVVEAAAERPAAHLEHAQAAALGAVFLRHVLERDHAVRQAVQLQVVVGGGAVVEQQHRALLADEELLERQHLAPVAQRMLREQAHLRQRVEHDARRLAALDLAQDRARGVGQLDLRRMEQARLAVGGEVLVRGQQLVAVDAVQAPAVRVRHALQLLLGLGERDVHALFTGAPAFEQVLERERGLAGARVPLDQVDAVRREAARENVVEAGDPRRHVSLGGVVHRSEDLFLERRNLTRARAAPEAASSGISRSSFATAVSCRFDR